MHYVTRSSHWMEKHMCSIMCHGTLFVLCIPVAPEHEKYRVKVSWPRLTGMHYVTHISHRMQKYKFCGLDSLEYTM
jgi:hypothetical protein